VKKFTASSSITFRPIPPTSPEVYDVLDRAVQVLSDYPNTKIEIKRSYR